MMMSFKDIFDAADRNAPDGQIGLGAAFMHLRQMVAEGASEAEQKAYIDEVIPDDPDEERRRGPKCRKCRDSGWCQIMSAKAVRDAIAGEMSQETVDVKCNCRRGDQLAAGIPKTVGTSASGKPPVRLGERDWHFLASDPERFTKAAQYTHKPANYNDAFDGMG